MKATILSINAVVEAYQSRTVPKVALELPVKMCHLHLLQSVQSICDAHAAYVKRIEAIPKVDLLGPQIRLKESIKHLSLKILATKTSHRMLRDSDQHNLLHFLEKRSDENFHSDYIASLLNPEFTGEFAHKLFQKLISHASGDPGKIFGTLQAMREVRLDTLNYGLVGKEKGARRIDLLIQTSSHLLVIENKVYSNESEDQTSDYKNAVEVFNLQLLPHLQKKVCHLFLTPSGSVASCTDFEPISYKVLYQYIKEISGSAPKRSADQFIHPYLNSLYDAFYASEDNYIDYLKAYWRIA